MLKDFLRTFEVTLKCRNEEKNDFEFSGEQPTLHYVSDIMITDNLKNIAIVYIATFLLLEIHINHSMCLS